MKLSITKINSFLDCPRKYWYMYDLKMGTPKSEGFFFGSAIHEGLENFYNGKNPMEGVRQALFSKKKSIKEEAKEGVDPYKLYKEARRIFDIYKKKAPKYKPLLVEYRFEVELIHPKTQKQLPATLVGKIDLITDKAEVIDHKTASGSSSSFFEDKNTFQASGYVYAYWKIFGKMPAGFIFNTIIKGNSKHEPRIEQNFVNIGLEHLCVFFNKCEDVLGKITREETRDYPNTSHCRFCPFKDICPKKI